LNFRYTDGSDKLVAFERGMSNEDVHTAFESGLHSVIVDETYLVAYSVGRDAVREHLRRRLYDNGGTEQGVIRHLRREARIFNLTVVITAQ
jgi:hypothetical protein